ncbi:MAG: succinate dehydrogenase/fumarate reductase iron-sulfur subunit [Myxococcota bacterium]|jgi:succinate dehydrogenase / fumarate reductase iron-sulfur subunit|nr:succinate dehydrogenase/fumarate reductase iron-sulfur subunit [Myxococcota bacterium]
MEKKNLGEQAKRPIDKTINLRVWRQPRGSEEGRFVDYEVSYIDDMSFLETLDVLNEELVAKGEDPIAFDYDCREGICGSCGMVVDGVPHGPHPNMTICQVHMRHLQGMQSVAIEPWRVGAFPHVKDLVVDRSAYDKLIVEGGYTSFNVGGAPDANALPISKAVADEAFDYAACVGCGACAAACKNAAAHLFVGAKVAQLALLPQGSPERKSRALAMVDKMDELGFGSCSNEGECEAVCPKGIKTKVIAVLNREYLRASLARL